MCATSVFQRNYTVYVNKVPVTEADMMATNGVVHAVNTIIKPLRESHLVCVCVGFLCHCHHVIVSPQLLKWTESRQTVLLLISE